MTRVLHITNWYPNQWNPHETRFIKEHYDAGSQDLEQDLWHVQVRNEGALFRLHGGDYSRNEHFLILNTRISVWRLQEMLTFLLLILLRIKLGKKSWDVVNVHIAYPLLRFTSLFMHLFGKAIVITEHWSAYKNNFFLPVESNSAKRIADIFSHGLPVISVSRALMNDIVRFVGHSDFPQYIVPNVVDPEIFYPNANRHNQDLVFLMVASWTSIKRPFLAMQAFIELLSDFPEAELRIVGAGPQFSEMQEFVKRGNLDNRIKLLGPMSKPEIAREMRQADCFLHASDYETFSVVCAEAMSCGLPVIASNVGGIPEFIDEKHGMLVENRLEDWVAGLKDFAAGKCNLERESNFVDRNTRFSPCAIERELTLVYESSVLGDGK